VKFILTISLLFSSLFAYKKENEKRIFTENMVFLGEYGKYSYLEIEAYGTYIEKRYPDTKDSFKEYHDYKEYKNFLLENSISSSTPLSKIMNLVKWSREFELGLPETEDELLKVEAIITNVGVNSRSTFYSSNPERKITYIPKEIEFLQNLIYLNLENNSISTLPPEIGNLKKLENISLGNNRISTLPPEIGKLPNLKTLYLYNNDISEIPRTIYNSENLRFLNIQENRVPDSERDSLKLSLPNCKIY
jgi:Leucine-rich repeat (LRR) protein